MSEMANLSRSQEREERVKMGRGMLTSIFGLIFCWVPLLGLLLSSVGFVKVSMRLTTRHRARYATYFIATLLILILCTGAL
ncbi:MAG: hypothetical protein GX558_06215, partial [Clostridiales bacterium]|nr:hypothetical protein [Clostridiales bacterium]